MASGHCGCGEDAIADVEGDDTNIKKKCKGQGPAKVFEDLKRKTETQSRRRCANCWHFSIGKHAPSTAPESYCRGERGSGNPLVSPTLPSDIRALISSASTACLTSISFCSLVRCLVLRPLASCKKARVCVAHANIPSLIPSYFLRV